MAAIEPIGLGLVGIVNLVLWVFQVNLWKPYHRRIMELERKLWESEGDWSKVDENEKIKKLKNKQRKVLILIGIIWLFGGILLVVGNVT